MRLQPHYANVLTIQGLDGNPVPVKDFSIHQRDYDFTVEISVLLDFDLSRFAEYVQELARVPSLDSIVRGWQKESMQCQQS